MIKWIEKVDLDVKNCYNILNIDRQSLLKMYESFRPILHVTKKACVIDFTKNLYLKSSWIVVARLYSYIGGFIDYYASLKVGFTSACCSAAFNLLMHDFTKK